MNFIYGLGNPGKQYQQTRHNAGFMFVEYLLQQVAVSAKFVEQKKLGAEVARAKRAQGDLLLAKPQTFMNRSGQAVRSTLEYYADDMGDFLETDSQDQPPHLIVAHDDLDIEIGSLKLQFGTGPQGHNGLNSIYQHLGTKDFWHLRLGVDGRGGERRIPPDRYVLQQFPSSERQRFDQTLAAAHTALQKENLI